MKRIEVMAKMDELNVAQEIITFLREHNLANNINAWSDGKRLYVLYGLAQYLGEDVGEVEE